MLDQIYSEMIGMISVSSPQEDNAAIPRDAQIALELEIFEEDAVQNLEEKEHMIMRDG